MKNNLHPLSLCTAALTVLLLGAGITTKAQSPTAPALNFNVFIQKGAKLSSNETEGPVALGGDLSLIGNYRVATKSAGTFKVSTTTIGLVVGGKLVFNSGNQNYVNNGYVKIGDVSNAKVWYKDNNNANSNMRINTGSWDANPSLNLQTSAFNLGVSATVNPVAQAGLIDFSTAFATMQTNSKNMSAYATNIELTNPNGDKKGTTIPGVLTSGQLKVNLKVGTNVLNVTGTELNSVSGNITFNNQPDATHILVVNVNATGTFNWSVWNQAGIGSSNSPYIIYNFYNTTNLQIEGNSTIEGTVFAPYADITKTANQSNIEGQVIGLSYYQTAGTNTYYLFAPTLANTNVPAISMPTIGTATPVFTNAAINSVSLAWTNGNGAARMVIARKSSEAGTPTDGVAYTANAKFGSGTAVGSGYVVYNGTGSAVTVTNLEAGATYYFTIIEYNVSGVLTAYNSTLKLVKSFATLADSDSDGVADIDDFFPNDATKAFSVSFPSTGFGSLMYEDLWPNKGDYDFNDLVVDYRIITMTNAASNIAEIEYDFVPKAAGAASKNGFAFQLDGISPDKIISVTGSKMTTGWSQLNSNGTEAGQPTNTNIIVFDDAFKTFNNLPAGSNVVNTIAVATHFTADTIKIKVKFKTDVLGQAALTSVQFNPYLIINQTRGREVHMADRIPSAKMDATYFGQFDDNSNAATGKYFKSKNNLPWALNIINSIPYALERVDITSAYTKFITWALSAGTTNADWYLDAAGNRVSANLYK